MRVKGERVKGERAKALFEWFKALFESRVKVLETSGRISKEQVKALAMRPASDEI